jgi:hypothetical protein
MDKKIICSYASNYDQIWIRRSPVLHYKKADVFTFTRAEQKQELEWIYYIAFLAPSPLYYC